MPRAQRLLGALFLVAGATTARAVSAQAVQSMRVSHVVACPRCSIELTQLVTLKPVTDQFWFGANSTLLKLPRGGYLAFGVGGTPSPQLFSDSGLHLRALMRQGSGPGEATNLVNQGAIAAHDTLIAYVTSGVPGRSRRVVFSPDLESVRSENVAGASPQYAFLVSSDGRAVMSMNSSAVERAGLPLHILDSKGSIVRSFGRSDPGIPTGISGSDRVRLMYRSLVPGSPNTFWSFQGVEPVIEQWSFDGRLLQRLAFGADGWYSASARQLGWTPADRMVRMSFELVQSASPDLLWITHTIVADASARRNAANIPGGGSDLVVEALDVRSGCILASRRFPNVRAAREIKYGRDLLATYVDMDQDYSMIQIRRIALIRPAGTSSVACERR